jgi:integrase/recombinase XerD
MNTSSVSGQPAVVVDKRLLCAAVAAYLGRYRGESRVHTGSDLKVFLTWCSGQDLDPLSVGRAEIERYVRWLREVRCCQPSTVSRRLSERGAGPACTAKSGPNSPVAGSGSISV